MRNQLLQNLQPSNPPNIPRPKRLPKDRSGWTFDGYFRTFWRRTGRERSAEKMGSQNFKSLKRTPLFWKRDHLLGLWGQYMLSEFLLGSGLDSTLQKKKLNITDASSRWISQLIWHTLDEMFSSTCSMKVKMMCSNWRWIIFGHLTPLQK